MPDSNSYRDDPEAPDLLPIGAVAKAFNVTPSTVRLWELKGHITALRTPGGQRRFRRADVEALLADEPARSA